MMDAMPQDQDNRSWYTTPDPQVLPWAMRVPEAGALVGVAEATAYKLARTEWGAFTKRTKGGLLLVRTSGLLAWLNEDNQSTTEEEKHNGNG
jgi:hypothetical protein